MIEGQSFVDYVKEHSRLNKLFINGYIIGAFSRGAKEKLLNLYNAGKDKNGVLVKYEKERFGADDNKALFVSVAFVGRARGHILAGAVYSQVHTDYFLDYIHLKDYELIFLEA